MMPLCTSASAVADVRVRVGFGDAAVRGPARVADAERGVEAFGLRGRFPSPPRARCGARGARRVAVDHGDAGRVVTAVFQPLESFDQDRNHIAIRDRADDAAHV